MERERSGKRRRAGRKSDGAERGAEREAGVEQNDGAGAHGAGIALNWPLTARSNLAYFTDFVTYIIRALYCLHCSLFFQSSLFFRAAWNASAD